MNSLPVFAQWLQLLATFAIAIFVAFIGYRQWRTAHERVILDLFDKRYQIVTDLRGVIATIVREGRAPTSASFDFLRSMERAKFLFGPEVNAYLDEVRRKLVDLHLAETKIEHTGGDERTGWIDRESKIFEEVSYFHERLNKLIERYMRMHQKL